MRVSLSGTHWKLDDIGDVEWFMLVQLPEAADFTRSEQGRKRILPDPSDEDSDLVADWREFVVPELETQFTRSVETVAGDLANAEEFENDDGATLHRLEIPIDRGETWYQVLNQARLLMNEEHNITGSEQRLILGEDSPSEIDEKKWLLMVQFRIYAAIQEFILTSIMGG